VLAASYFAPAVGNKVGLVLTRDGAAFAEQVR